MIRSLCLLLFLCACDGFSALESSAQDADVPHLSPDQQRRTEALVSFFEHSTLEKQYSYWYALGDGRGYTLGWIGFTTSSGSAAEVIRRYKEVRELAPIVRYLPELDRLKQGFQGDVSGLDGLPEAWAQAAADPLFQQAQDEVARDWYYAPAQRYAAQLGTTTPLALALLYDTAIQHGDGHDADGLSAILGRAGEIPARGAEETDWLHRFVDARRRTLMNPSNVATRAAWRESVWRVEVWQQILDAERYQLGSGIRIAGSWFDFRLP